MKILILEDNLIRIEKFKQLFKNQQVDFCQTAQDAKDACLLNDYSVFWLDHDLGGIDFQDPDSETSGYSVCAYIARTGWPINEYKVPVVWIHSSNLFAANLMIHTLLVGGVHAYFRRFEYDIEPEKNFFDGKKTATISVHGKVWEGHSIYKCTSCKFEKLVNKDCQCKSCYQREITQCS